MAFPVVPLVAALWEMHKGGPPDSFSNSKGDQSPDATAARNRISDLVKSTGIEYQAAAVPQDAYKNPANLDNLYDRIQKMDVNAVTQLHQTWEGFRSKLEQGHNTFGPSILKAIQDKWTGSSGTQAANGISDFVKKENDLVISAQLVSEKMKLARSAVEITKPGAQPAPNSTWTSDVAGWVPGPTWKLNDHRKTEANSANEHLINNVFYPAVRESDTQVPKAPHPTNPVNKPGAIGPSVPGATGPSSSGASGPTGPSSAGASGPSTPGASGPSAGARGPGTENTTPSSDKPSSSSDSSRTPAATNTTPSSYDSKTTPSSADTSGLGTSGTGLGGSGDGNAGGGAGRSVPGGGASKSFAADAANAAAAKGTNSNLSGMGGLGGVAGKGKKDDEDREHKSKISEALVSEQNGDELTGLGRFAKKTIPQVLGE